MSISALSGSTVLHLNPSDTGAGTPPARAAKAGVAGEAAAPQERASDPVTEVIKQLQERLRQVMLQIRRLQASRIPEEQKLPQLRVLNSQAVQLQQQIAAAQEQKLRAARGSITA
ncbi:hypothetical protein [Bordetella petrii]|uniref:FlxA-like protein n=1 Tax=Bordetella petrii (strain ATCC BAA-461 / DSM 12804 / CCUG 43448 / CIP 107267 / Se-1111R) TaxID=340100 RepID=A9HXN1_BORPD|nr:hypothetical protein [Bordetella petrii]CAP43825.1 hypothetical protein predicted by Glimmer/Critica [Bordetella petrii]